jgi:hypothetical protein
MICWKANLTDFASDLLCLVEDQIALANSDPGAHQRSLSALLPFHVSRNASLLMIRAYPGNVSLFTAVYGRLARNWNNLAEAPVQEFKAGAAELLQGAKLLKDHFKGRLKT